MAAINELTSLRRTRASRSPAQRRDGRAAVMFLAPWFLGVVVIVAGPLVASLYLAFTDYNLVSDPTFIGWDNFLRILHDTRLHTSLRVTFTYVLVSVPLQLIVALGLALLLDTGMKGLSFYRSVFYLPSMLGTSVAISILWRQIFGTDGLVNHFLGWFGIQGQGWVSHPDYALATLIILNVWTFGAPMVIFLAGLRQIPSMYYEASMIDGATKLRQLRSITIPLLTPIIFFNLVLQVINVFQTFTQSYVISNGTGGPVDSTLFYTLYLYQRGFASLDMGYASAMAWLLLLIIAAMTAVNFLASKYWVFYDD